MFEYLMPLLVMPTYDGTLLDATYDAVVARQIEYGRERGIPWGISECCYNLTDAHLNYQYRAFGVPGLGFMRGLADDLVVAPYATILAADGRAGKRGPQPGAALPQMASWESMAIAKPSTIRPRGSPPAGRTRSSVHTWCIMKG